MSTTRVLGSPVSPLSGTDNHMNAGISLYRTSEQDHSGQPAQAAAQPKNDGARLQHMQLCRRVMLLSLTTAEPVSF